MDKIKQVIVMRTDLNMRKGKMVAQGAHAAMMFLIDLLIPNLPLDSIGLEWIKTGMIKACVQVPDLITFNEIEKKALDSGIRCTTIVDRGYTEFHGVPTITAMAIGPYFAEEIDKITGHLKLL